MSAVKSSSLVGQTQPVVHGAVLLIGAGLLVDSLAKALITQGIEVERASVDQVAARARVVTPDLIIVADDAVRDRGAAVLAQLQEGQSGAPVPVLLIRAPERDATAQSLRHVGCLSPTSGVGECARRVRTLIERIVGEGIASDSFQQIVDVVAVRTKPLVTPPSAAGKDTQRAANDNAAAKTGVSGQGAAAGRKRTQIDADGVDSKPKTVAGTRLSPQLQASQVASPRTKLVTKTAAVGGNLQPTAAAASRAQIEVAPLSASPADAGSAQVAAAIREAIALDSPVVSARRPPLPARSAQATLVEPVATRTAAVAPPSTDDFELDVVVSATVPPPRAQQLATPAPTPQSTNVDDEIITRTRRRVVDPLASVSWTQRRNPLAAANSGAGRSVRSPLEASSSWPQPKIPGMLASAAAEPSSTARSKSKAVIAAAIGGSVLLALGWYGYANLAGEGSAKGPQPAESLHVPEQFQPQANAVTAVQAPDAVQPFAPAPSKAAAPGQARPARDAQVAPELTGTQKLVEDATALLNQGRFGLAEGMYLKALQSAPSDAAALAGVVRVHLGRHDGVEAMRWVTRLIAAQPQNTSHQLLLGDVLALRGEKDAARAAWTRAANGGNTVARERLTR